MCGERRAGESEEDWDRRRGFCFVCGGVPVLNDRVCTTRSFTEFHLHVCLQPTVANVLLQLDLELPRCHLAAACQLGPRDGVFLGRAERRG